MENEVSNLEISKQFESPKEQLYKAWTDAEQLKLWWKPMGKQLAEVTNDLSEGGAVKYSFEGGDLTIDGTYEKVTPGELLEYTWNWHSAEQTIEDASYKLSVKFTGEGNESTISITQQGFNNKESVQPHQHGWEQGLQQLHDYLSKETNESTSADGADAGGKPPITGYNETPEQEKVAGG